MCVYIYLFIFPVQRVCPGVLSKSLLGPKNMQSEIVIPEVVIWKISSRMLFELNTISDKVSIYINRDHN